jgi:hypothetical protein
MGKFHNDKRAVQRRSRATQFATAEIHESEFGFWVKTAERTGSRPEAGIRIFLEGFGGYFENS